MTKFFYSNGNRFKSSDICLEAVISCEDGKTNKDSSESKAASASSSSTAPNLGAFKANEKEVGEKPTPGEVTNAMRSATLHDPLKDGGDQVDFTEDEEAKIAAATLKLNEEDDNGPPAKKSFAKVVAKQKIRGYEILYVHLGTENRAPIPRETFEKLYDRINMWYMDKILEGEAVHDNIIWRSWKDGRGLICTGDKESSDYISELIGKIQIQKTSFKAWKRGQFGFGRLVTCELEGKIFNSLSKERLMSVLMKQNKLVGNYTNATVKPSDKGPGRVLRFWADQELWKDLISRRETVCDTKLWLKMAAQPVKASLSKEKRDKSPGGAVEKPNVPEDTEAAVAAQNLGTSKVAAEVDPADQGLPAKAPATPPEKLE